jgi:ribose 5-phosphate isomerase B
MGSGKTVLLASDHNGNDERVSLREWLLESGHSPVDLGPGQWKRVDYNDYADQVAYAVQRNPELRGILICGTGIGMSIAANRYPGVHASLVHDPETARLTREHNDSNVLCLRSWKSSDEERKEIVSAWLDQEWGKGRHVARVRQLDRDLYQNRIVLVPGVFDVLMPGHVELLKHAKKIGMVVVAVNTDESAERIKGKRPHQPEDWRRRVVHALGGVDEVVVFDGDVGKIARQVGADYVVKGDEWTEEEVRRNDGLPDDVEVVLFPIQRQFERDE